MPTLTIEAIRENPWTVLTHSLPPHPTEVLLELACVAAAYCRASEHLLMFAARKGNYTPLGWEPRDDGEDIHEESEGRWFEAEKKHIEFLEIFAARFGRSPDY